MYIPITRGDSYVATFRLLEADGTVHEMLPGEQLTFSAKTSKGMSAAKISRYFNDGIDYNAITQRYEIDLPSTITSDLIDIDYPFDIEYVSQVGKVKTLLQGVFRVCLDVTEPQNRERFNGYVDEEPWEPVQKFATPVAEPDHISNSEIVLGDFKFSNAYRDKMAERTEVVPSDEEQIIRPKSDVFELVEVVVKPVPSHYTDVSETTAEAKDVVSGKVFYDKYGNRVSGSITTSSIVVKSTREEQNISSDDGKLFDEILVEPIVGSKEVSSNGKHDVADVADVFVNVQPRLQTKAVEPTTEQQEVGADAEYDGLEKVLVGAVNPSDYHKPETAVTITPSLTEQKIQPQEGQVFNDVVVKEITSNLIPNLVSSNIRAGVTILGVEGNVSSDKPDQTKSVEPQEYAQSVKPDTGYELTEVNVGAISNKYIGSAVERKGAEVYEISESDRVIPADTYLIGSQTIKGVKLDQKTAIPSTEEQIITSDVNGLRTVIVKPIPSNWLDTTNEANIYKGEVE